MRQLSVALLLFAIAAAKPAPKAYFQFQSGYWVNLHQTLFREAVRLDSKMDIQPLDTRSLTGDQSAAWNKAVGYYQQQFHGKSLVFDDELIKINDALEASPDPNSKLAFELPRELQAQLVAASPVYQRAWWPAQQKQNQQWIAWATPLVAEYAPEVVPRLEEKFHTKWPAYPLRVDVSYFVAASVSYDSYAEHNGLYTRGQWPKFKKAIDQAWPAYLEGKTDWESAVKEMVKAYEP